MNMEVIGGLIRHALTVAGGALVAQGGIDEPTVTAGVGAVMTLLGIGWSYYAKRRGA